MALYDEKTTREATSRHQSDRVFSKALSRGFMEELQRLLLKRSQRLLPFDEVKEKLELWYVEDLGLRSVPIDSIIGSQGRYKNFTRHFMPLDENLRARWKKVDDIKTGYFRMNLHQMRCRMLLRTIRRFSQIRSEKFLAGSEGY